MSMLLFAAGFPAAGVLLESWGPMSLIAFRCALATGLILVIWWAVDGTAALKAAPWGRGIWIGALGFGSGTVMLLWAQDMTDAVTAALVTASMPVSAVALEVMFDRRRLTWFFVAGLSLVLIGGLIATGADLGNSQFGIGAAIGLAATVIFTWGSRATVKQLPDMTGLGQAAITFVGALVFCLAALAASLALGLPGTEIGRFDANSVTMLALYAFAAMGISQILWIIGVSRMGIGLASFHLNAVPFYVMLMALAFGGAWSWDQALGAGLLAIGVVLAQRSDRRVTVPAE